MARTLDNFDLNVLRAQHSLRILGHLVSDHNGICLAENEVHAPELSALALNIVFDDFPAVMLLVNGRVANRAYESGDEALVVLDLPVHDGGNGTVGVIGQKTIVRGYRGCSRCG